MQTVTIQPAQPHETVLQCPPPRVFVDGSRRRDMEVASWSSLPGPKFGQVRLGSQQPVSSVESPGVEDFRQLPPVGSAVVVTPAPGAGQAEFHGLVARHILSAGKGGERLVAEVDHYLAGTFAEPVAGRWELASSGATRVANAPLRFNMSADSFASQAKPTVATRQVRVFDDSADSLRWTVADALSYLIAAEVPAGDLGDVPDDDELQHLAGGVDLGSYDGRNKTLPDVLCDIAHRGGLEVRPVRFGRGFAIYRPGVTGRAGVISLQTPGQSLDSSRTNIASGKIIFNRRPSQRPVRVIGGIKQYESTFDLQPGWDPGLESDDWRDFVRSDSPDWPQRSRVFRAWVLNEHDRYTTAFGLARHDFSDISEADFTAIKARVFQPALSLDTQGNSLGIVVETRTSPGGSWLRWPGVVWVSDDECTITLGGDAIGGEFFDAAVAHQAQVRVTASVDSDARIAFEIPGDRSMAWEVADLSARAGYEAITYGSEFYTGTGEARTVVRDDTPMLASYARNLADAGRGATEAAIKLGWVDTSWAPGDIVARIAGRELELTAGPRTQPSVAAVLHEFNDKQQTTLTVTG